MKFDFSGWATRNNLRCSDGRVIMHNAFKDDDGKNVPLVWNHQHNDPFNVLGNVQLEHREDGVYAYGVFNDTEQGRNAKLLVQHGDIVALSICAGGLKQQGGNVMHGDIKEVSLVLAGANPGAYIESVLVHGEESDEEAIIYTGENIELNHSSEGDPEKKDEPKDDLAQKGKTDESPDKDDPKKDDVKESVGDVFATLTDKQKTAVYNVMTQLLEDDETNDNSTHTEGGNEEMKHNVFEGDPKQDQNILTHSDQMDIINMAKSSGVGSLRTAMSIFADEHEDTLAHGFDSIETLFPDAKELRPGAPEIIPQNNGWVDSVIKKAHKTPFSRIRTRQADVSAVRAGGYKTKGSKKTDMGNVSLVNRSTDPQTVYIKDKLNRDDIVDITDFDVVQYQYGVMRNALHEELALAMLIGDGRESGDEQKIEETHVRSIWNDDELYTVHADVDFAKAKAELQGTNTAANFGENYVYAEAIVAAALYAREQYKGSGAMSFYCTPHLLNTMLLARDMNGRRIYNSKTDLTQALDVSEIHTVEEFEGKTRKTADREPKTKKLLGIFVNMADYNIGAVKNGEVAQFNQFDIDFNQEKFLIETRLSGALTRVKSAIALEEDTTTVSP